MTDYTIMLEQNGAHGRYVIDLGQGAEAEMNFRRNGNVMTITHTGVPHPFEGRGIAAQLVQRAVADARAQGFKIVPACSYVVALFKRHAKDWSDVRAD
jgi:uncharacterized protein